MQPVLVIHNTSIKKGNTLIGHNFTLLTWDRSKWSCDIKTSTISRNKLQALTNNKNFYPCNYTITSDSRLINKSKYKNFNDVIHIILDIASIVRIMMVKQYGAGTNLAGHCIEASEFIATAINIVFKDKVAQTVEGWCLYDDEDYGSDRPYSEHTWVSTRLKGFEYLDVTADQFNVAMDSSNEFKNIVYGHKLPHGIMLEQPVEGEDYWANY